MKHTDPKTDMKIRTAACVFGGLLCLVAALFVIASLYIAPPEVTEGGKDDTEGGTATLGSGSGEGLGGSASGDGSGDGLGGSASGDGSGEAAAPGKKAAENTQETPPAPEAKGPSGEPEAQDGQSGGGSDRPTGKAPEKRGQKLGNPEEKEQSQVEESQEESSFSSGGKSVFKVKKDENVLFILDISGSMYVYKTREGLSCLEVLIIQLKSTVQTQKKAGSRGKYAFIAFDGRSHFFPDDEKYSQLRFKSEKDYRKAEAWIDQLRSLGGGNTALYPALELAVKKINNRTIKVDTIYLLTDGAPSDYKRNADYIALLKNLPGNVRINTISIGRTSQLLKDIAKEFKGQYEEYK